MHHIDTRVVSRDPRAYVVVSMANPLLGKRPGMEGGGGALVPVKRPRQELVPVGADARTRQLVQSVSWVCGAL